MTPPMMPPLTLPKMRSSRVAIAGLLGSALVSIASAPAAVGQVVAGPSQEEIERWCEGCAGCPPELAPAVDLLVDEMRDALLELRLRQPVRGTPQELAEARGAQEAIETRFIENLFALGKPIDEACRRGLITDRRLAQRIAALTRPFATERIIDPRAILPKVLQASEPMREEVEAALVAAVAAADATLAARPARTSGRRLPLTREERELVAKLDALLDRALSEGIVDAEAVARSRRDLTDALVALGDSTRLALAVLRGVKDPAIAARVSVATDAIERRIRERQGAIAQKLRRGTLGDVSAHDPDLGFTDEDWTSLRAAATGDDGETIVAIARWGRSMVGLAERAGRLLLPSAIDQLAAALPMSGPRTDNEAIARLAQRDEARTAGPLDELLWLLRATPERIERDIPGLAGDGRVPQVAIESWREAMAALAVRAEALREAQMKIPYRFEPDPASWFRATRETLAATEADWQEWLAADARLVDSLRSALPEQDAEDLRAEITLWHRDRTVLATRRQKSPHADIPRPLPVPLAPAVRAACRSLAPDARRSVLEEALRATEVVMPLVAAQRWHANATQLSGIRRDEIEWIAAGRPADPAFGLGPITLDDAWLARANEAEAAVLPVPVPSSELEANPMIGVERWATGVDRLRTRIGDASPEALAAFDQAFARSYDAAEFESADRRAIVRLRADASPDGLEAVLRAEISADRLVPRIVEAILAMPRQTDRQLAGERVRILIEALRDDQHIARVRLGRDRDLAGARDGGS